MSISHDTQVRRENDRIDMAADWRVVVELETENLRERWAREAYLWHRINDAEQGKGWHRYLGLEGGER